MSHAAASSAKRPLGAVLFALALAVAPVALPVLPAIPAFASSQTPSEPFVTASTQGEIGSVRVEWYTDPGVSQVELVSRDSTGATTTRTLPAEQGAAVYTGLPAGDWSASVTAIASGSRSSTVVVVASIVGPASVAPTPVQPQKGEPAPVTEATAPAAAPVDIAFAVVPRDDGALQGGTARVMASGLAPGERFQVTLRSTAAVLTDGVVGADGSIDSTFAMPDEMTEGDDALVFSAVGTDGLPVTGEYGITVTAAPVLEEVVATPEVTAPETVVADEPEGIEALFALRGEEAVPALVVGTVGGTAATGAAVGAASVVNGRLRRLRISRLVDRDLAGLPPLPKGGFADTVRDLLTVFRGSS